MKKTMRIILPFLMFLNVGIYNTKANEYKNPKLKVFIEGSIPDFNYIREKVTFIDFVNDPKESDVHIIVTRKNTASSGKHYYIAFNPITINTLENFNLNCITSFEDTQDDIRQKFTESLKSGLLVMATEKQLYYQVNVTEKKSNQSIQPSLGNIKDPWDNWVFNIGLSGGFEAEEQKKNFEYESELSANRVTDIWRIRNEYSYSREETFITKEEESTKKEIHAYNQEQEFRSFITYSISSHWSVGLIAKGNQTTYRNIEFNGSLKPALEYNFYPWEEVNRRVFTAAYYVGPSYYDYYVPTILNKTSDFLWTENIKIDLEKTEKWGELEVWMEASHFFPNFKYYSLNTATEVSVRVTKGLFISFEIEAEKIQDQLYVQADELSDEELLLNLRKLPTSFEFSCEFGIKYQFGSIYNNIVNQRL